MPPYQIELVSGHAYPDADIVGEIARQLALRGYPSGGHVGSLANLNMAPQIAQAQQAFNAGFAMPQGFTGLAAPGVVVAKAPPTTQVQETAGGRIIRRQVLPVGSGVIAAGGTGTFSVLTQRPQRIDRLVITQYDAVTGAAVVGGQVQQILVGTDPQFSAAGNVDATMFAPTAFDTSLRGSTATPGITIAVQLSNPTAAGINFIVACIGESLD